MSINIVLAQAHQNQLQDEETRREYESVKNAFLSTERNFQDGTVNCVFIKGSYHDFEKKMTIVSVLVNKLDKPIKEIYGVLRLRFRTFDAEIAKATLDFDEAFMGQLKSDEGLLFHLNIPVKGLYKDQEFFMKDIEGSFDDVRFTYSE